MAETGIIAGRLLCGKVRDFLSLMQFKGHNIEYWESSGWIEREFIIRGSPESVRLVDLAFSKWKQELDNEHGKNRISRCGR